MNPRLGAEGPSVLEDHCQVANQTSSCPNVRVLTRDLAVLKISKKALMSLAVSGSRKRRKSVWRKLVLLMWKNLLLRRRHWLLTAFEILLPTLLFTLLVTIRVLPDSSFIPHFVDQASLHSTSNDLLVPATSLHLFCFSCTKL